MADPVSAGTPSGTSRPACAQADQASGPSTSEILYCRRFWKRARDDDNNQCQFRGVDHDRGVILNDAMPNFARPVNGSCLANAPGGGKRAQTAMAPVIATDQSGAPVLVGGSAGAGEIVDYVAQAVLELFSGRPPAEALDDGHISTARAPYGDSAGVVEGRAVAQFAE